MSGSDNQPAAGTAEPVAPRQLRPFGRRRTPSVMQIEVVECGAASLAMILAHHGRWIPLLEMRRLCGVSRDGSKALSLVRAARELGLTAQGLRRDPDKLIDLPLPAIVFVNLNHFVVLEHIGRGGVRINDPAQGRIRLTHAAFDEIYSGIVLTFVPTPAFGHGGERPRILGPLRKRLSGGGAAAAFVMVAGAGLVLPGVFLASYNRIFIDDFVIGGQTDWFFGLVAAMVATLLVQLGLAFVEGRIRIGLRNRICVSAAAGFMRRLLQLPVAFFSQRHPGSISSRIDTADILADLVANHLLTVPVAILSMVLFGLVMAVYSPLLALISLVTAVAGALLLLAVRDRLAETERKGTADNLKLSARTMQGLAMIEVMKGSGTETAYLEAWSGQQALVVNQRQRLGRIESALATAPDFLSHLGELVVLVVAGLLVMGGSLSLGMLVAFMSLQSSFFRPMQGLLAAATQMSKGRAVLDQFDDVGQHHLAPEFTVAPAKPRRDQQGADALGRVSKLEGAVVIRGLSFGYARLDKPLVQDFSLTLEPGSRVALVGGSGSGKSTIGRLVSGLLEPWEGTIEIDGRPLMEIPRVLLRNSMAVVDQDIAMFSGSVRDNITLWDETMPESTVVRAARDAMIHEDVVQRQGAYGARVEEGGRNFSGGQRQRLEIARALVTNPSLLILDEATSALDPVVEKAVMDNLRRRGCTCIIIAHRLSTIRDCDEIVVMERGRIVQRGTHEAMQAVDGPYRRLIET